MNLLVYGDSIIKRLARFVGLKSITAKERLSNIEILKKQHFCKLL